ncbi:MAG: nitronate monooxygenase [Porticoccaceae bacterium]
MKLELCEMVGVEFPLFAFSHCRDVVAAVSKAGGFGVFGGSTFTPEELKVELDWIDAHVNGMPYGVDLAIPQRQGVSEENLTAQELMEHIPAEHYAFANELLEQRGVNPVSSTTFARHGTSTVTDGKGKAPYMPDTVEEMIEEVFRHPVRLVVNALGVPPKLMLERAQARGIPVGACIGSLGHARQQLAAGVDVLIAQGVESAAHCGEISTSVLVTEVVEGIKDIRPVPVLAAGGIVTGRQMAAAMTLGAQGVWTGSVWLTTVESDVSPIVKERFFAASSRDTVRSRAITGKPARHLVNDWSTAWDGPGSPGALPFPLQGLLSEAVQGQTLRSAEAGNSQARSLLTEGVGQGVGMLKSSKSARTVVQEFMEDYANALERMRLLSGSD